MRPSLASGDGRLVLDQQQFVTTVGKLGFFWAVLNESPPTTGVAVIDGEPNPS